MNLKRWLLLFSGGVLCCAFSLALLFNDQTMGFVEEMLFRMSYMTTGRYNNGLMILAGIVGIAAGLIIMFYATRRIVHSVIDSVMPENNGSLMETIFTQRKLSNGPAVTVVGGGTGLSTLLRGMKYITGNCTAVVTVADDGGSSGRLRQELGIIPPGDLRNCLVAMADREPLMERVLQYRFQGDSALAGHNLGNLFLAAIAATEGGMEEGLNAASQILRIRGHVIPSTLESIQIKADMTDGTSVLDLGSNALAAFRGRRIGFVFQFHHLLPEFSSLENVMIPALIAGRSSRDARREAESLLDRMGLSERASHKPSELSGGEQQRVAIARALVNHPAVLFADEPTGNLDSATKEEIHKLFFELRDSLGQTIIIVTHDPALAALCDRSLTMKDGRFV